MDPEAVVHELAAIFTVFDDRVGEHGAEKTKTVGDGYVAAVGVPQHRDDHAIRGCALALDMLEAMPNLAPGWSPAAQKTPRTEGDTRMIIIQDLGEVIAAIAGAVTIFGLGAWAGAAYTEWRTRRGDAPGGTTISDRDDATRNG